MLGLFNSTSTEYADCPGKRNETAEDGLLFAKGLNADVLIQTEGARSYTNECLQLPHVRANVLTVGCRDRATKWHFKFREKTNGREYFKKLSTVRTEKARTKSNNSRKLA